MPQPKRKSLTELQDDFDPQAVEQLKERLNLPTVNGSNPLTVNTNSEAVEQVESKPDKPKSDRPKKINIDIGESRHNRLNELAARVRSNSSTPLAPSERMYPIHLIQMAIDFLLDGVDVNWDEIQKPEDLREALNSLKAK